MCGLKGNGVLKDEVPELGVCDCVLDTLATAVVIDGGCTAARCLCGKKPWLGVGGGGGNPYCWLMVPWHCSPAAVGTVCCQSGPEPQ